MIIATEIQFYFECTTLSVLLIHEARSSEDVIHFRVRTPASVEDLHRPGIKRKRGKRDEKDHRARS